MTAKIEVARKGGRGRPLGRRVSLRDPQLCRRCPCGIDVALTVFIPGKGDSTDDDGMYLYDTESTIQEFLDGLGAKIEAGGPPEEDPGPSTCCVHQILRVSLDSDRSVRQNGMDVANRLTTLLRAASQASGVRRMFIHLVGFSAGGMVAVEVARGISEGVRRDGEGCSLRRPRARQWCGHDVEQLVPVVIDVVTIATPYDPAFLMELGADLGMLLVGGWPAEFCTSVGALDFGGDSRPTCVCGYLAVVTDSADDEAGDQRPGAEVEEWHPTIVELHGATHVGALAAALEDSRLETILNPGCGCAIPNG